MKYYLIERKAVFIGAFVMVGFMPPLFFYLERYLSLADDVELCSGVGFGSLVHS